MLNEKLAGINFDESVLVHTGLAPPRFLLSSSLQNGLHCALVLADQVAQALTSRHLF
jgi:hypothetical protein